VIPYKIIGVVAVIAITAYFSFQAGSDKVRAEAATAMAIATHAEHKKVREIIKWKEKKVVIYRDRVQKIKVATDPTGCLDMDLRTVGLGGMLKPDSH
jgi:hypothetical protein